jgi:integral membrane protein (TIGR01906 family)
LLTKLKRATYDDFRKGVSPILKKREAGLALIRALVIGLFILAIPVALITTNIRVAISEQRVYDHAVRSYDADEASGIPERELLRANGEIKRYLTSGGDGSLEITVHNSEGETERLFNSEETTHMADVRGLVRTLFTAQVASVFFVLTLAIVLAIWSPRTLARGVLQGALLTGGVLLAAGVVAASGFDAAWTQFHQLAFTNDFWELDPRTDHLIQMFPEAFWQEITTVIVMATLLEAFLMVSASVAYLTLTRPPDAELLPVPAPAIAGSAGHASAKLASSKPRQLFR